MWEKNWLAYVYKMLKSSQIKMNLLAEPIKCKFSPKSHFFMTIKMNTGQLCSHTTSKIQPGKASISRSLKAGASPYLYGRLNVAFAT